MGLFMGRFVVFALGIFLLGAPEIFANGSGSSTPTRPETLGSYQTKVQFPLSWQRQILDKDSGKDQFAVPFDSKYLIIFSNEGFVASPKAMEVFTKRVTDFLIKRSPLHTKVMPLPTIRYKQVLYIRHRVDTKFNDLNISYVVGAVNVGGTGYTILAWSFPPKFEELDQEVASICSSMTNDGENAEFQSRFKESGKSFSDDNALVRLKYAPLIYQEDYSNPNEGKWSVRNEDFQVELKRVKGFSPGTLQADWPDFQIQSTGEMTVGDHAKNPRKYTYYYAVTRSDPPRSRLSVFLSPERQDGFELRMDCPYDFDAMIPLMKQWLKNASYSPAPGMAAYLPREEAQDSSAYQLVRPFIEGAKEELRLHSQVLALGWKSSGSALVATRADLEELGPGSVPVRMVSWPQNRYQRMQIFDWKGSLYIKEGTEKTQVLNHQTLDTAPGWDEVRFALGGEKVLGIVRTAPASALQQIISPENASDQLTLVDAEGKEFPALGDLDWEKGALNPASDKVLYVSAVAPLEASGRLDKRLTLWEKNSGKKLNLGLWKTVTDIQTSPEGWFVLGDPGQGTGLWKVSFEGKQELIFRGDQIKFLAVNQGRLWFSSRWTKEGKQLGWSEDVLYSLPMAQARSLASKVDPFSADLVDRCAVQAGLGDSFPPLASQGDLMILYQRFKGLLSQEAGTDFLPGAGYLDTYLERYAEDGRKRPALYRGLLILFAGNLVDQGARWVPPGSEPRLHPGSQAVVENLYAKSYLLQGILNSIVDDDDDGWRDPSQTLMKDTQGRQVLVGFDPATLQLEMEKPWAPPAPEKQSPAEVSQWAEWLSADHLKTNDYLRSRLWQTWTGKAQTPFILALMTELEKRGQLRPIDRIYLYYAHWLQLGTTDLNKTELTQVFNQAPEKAVAGLRILAADFPQEKPLLFLLGKAWEFSGYGYGIDNAKTCYQKLMDDYSCDKKLKDMVQASFEKLEPKNSVTTP